MEKLMNFRNEDIKVIPLSIVSALLLFVLTLTVEALLGGIFYAVGTLLKDQSIVIASSIINVGLWITKVVIVAMLLKTYTFVRGDRHYLLQLRKLGKRMDLEPTDSLVIAEMDESLESPFKAEVSKGHLKYFFGLIVLLVVAFRMAYDSQIGQMVLDFAGLDPSLVESMELILGAPVLGVLYVVLIGPVYEEIVFRGFILGGLLRRGYGFFTAAVVSSALFGLLHLNVAQGINAFFVGLLAATLYYWTGNLKYAITLHMVNNIFVSLSGAVVEKIIEKASLWTNLGTSFIGLLMTFYVLRIIYVKTQGLSDR